MQNAPSLKALKLMHLMIATAGGRMAEPVQHEMRLSDIRKIDGMGHHTHETLKPLWGTASGNPDPRRHRQKESPDWGHSRCSFAGL